MGGGDLSGGVSPSQCPCSHRKRSLTRRSRLSLMPLERTTCCFGVDEFEAKDALRQLLLLLILAEAMATSHDVVMILVPPGPPCMTRLAIYCAPFLLMIYCSLVSYTSSRGCFGRDEWSLLYVLLYGGHRTHSRVCRRVGSCAINSWSESSSYSCLQ